ncbi:WhiB family transcriptional regulator [Gordonia rhizosphera]|uniref:Transcriptional regulator WhiB n=1 Tax=Gordonia rhizosphera NBRC 16068 TaxID=1108045 RepID=K6VWH4_9ACTN|nr:WhiB family transcriptional regulator [Gordonia rhizosphera]GAB91255.1 putative WhiB family regulatory protein [Gordonia rhizosphera NBRC 16068]
MTSDRITRIVDAAESGDSVRARREEPHWREDAGCRGADPAVFFPASELSAVDKARHERTAKLICGNCPVRRQCHDFAAIGPEPYGIWGGMTPTERKRRHRRAQMYRRVRPSEHGR